MLDVITKYKRVQSKQIKIITDIKNRSVLAPACGISLMSLVYIWLLRKPWHMANITVMHLKADICALLIETLSLQHTTPIRRKGIMGLK